MTKMFSISATPNVNSIKITFDKPQRAAGSKTYNSAAEAGENHLVAELFGVEGVKSVFVLNNFITVTRHPEANWDQLVPAVEAIAKKHDK